MSDRGLLDKVQPRCYPRAFTKKIKARESLLRRVPVHPAHFVVGMDDPERPLFPPAEKVKGTAIQCASYVARVEEVGEDGAVTVTLWERPNGREGLTALSVDEHLAGQWPNVGDLLWIWTWIDVHEGARKKCIHVVVDKPELMNEDRVALGRMLDQLKWSGA